jgi:hypothetical protein
MHIVRISVIIILRFVSYKKSGVFSTFLQLFKSFPILLKEYKVSTIPFISNNIRRDA